MDGFTTLIKSDLARLGPVTVRQFLRRVFLPSGTTFPYILWFRIVQCARRRAILKWTLGVVAYPILRHYEFKYGIHANPNIDIGKGMLIMHGDGVYLNCTSIGENLTVYQGVTFGIMDGGLPSVGNNVTVYPQSVVAGGIKIGDNAVIGALSYVSRSVNCGDIVVGAPARSISKDKSEGKK